LTGITPPDSFTTCSVTRLFHPGRAMSLPDPILWTVFGLSY
jgi:hypothetical protein